MTQWEYLIDTFSAFYLEVGLKMRGEEGWELVSERLHPDHAFVHVCIFKRPLKEKP